MKLFSGLTETDAVARLQAEGHNVDFRNVRLLNLEGCMDPKNANYKRYYVKSNPAACR